MSYNYKNNLNISQKCNVEWKSVTWDTDEDKKKKKSMFQDMYNKAIHCLIMQIVWQNYKETKGMIHTKFKRVVTFGGREMGLHRWP